MQNAFSQFIFNLEYLQELNDTGSFPDEDKTSMCYLKCLLELHGAQKKDGSFDNGAILRMFEMNGDEAINGCLTEISKFPYISLSCKCHIK